MLPATTLPSAPRNGGVFPGCLDDATFVCNLGLSGDDGEEVADFLAASEWVREP